MGLINGIGQLVGRNIHDLGINTLNIGRSVNWAELDGGASLGRAHLPGVERGNDEAPPGPPRRNTFSGLHESLIVARSAVEDNAEILQVPESQIHDVLDKIQALEDQVRALLEGEGQDIEAAESENKGDADSGSGQTGEKSPVPEANDGAGSAAKDDEEDDTKDTDDDSKTGRSINARLGALNSILTALDEPTPPGGAVFKEDDETEGQEETDVHTSAVVSSRTTTTKTMTNTRTSTITLSSTTQSTAVPEDPPAPVDSEKPETQIFESSRTQSKEEIVSEQPEPTAGDKPTVSNATTNGLPPAVHTPRPPTSLPGHIASGLLPTTRPVPGASLSFANTTVGTAFQTITRPGGSSESA